MKYKEVACAVTSVLDEAGITYTTQWRGKHPFVDFVYDGKSQKLWLPASPSDVRGLSNARAFTRRLLRRLRG